VSEVVEANLAHARRFQGFLEAAQKGGMVEGIAAEKAGEDQVLVLAKVRAPAQLLQVGGNPGCERQSVRRCVTSGCVGVLRAPALPSRAVDSFSTCNESALAVLLAALRCQRLHLARLMRPTGSRRSATADGI
jgi:hypothetical protein